MTDAPSAFGAEVRQLRRARGMTLRDPSGESGVSLSHLSAIERGSSNSSMDALHAIAGARSVSTDCFFARRSGRGLMERAYVVSPVVILKDAVKNAERRLERETAPPRNRDMPVRQAGEKRA